jgi:hypothetical protein
LSETSLPVTSALFLSLLLSGTTRLAPRRSWREHNRAARARKRSAVG